MRRRWIIAAIAGLAVLFVAGAGAWWAFAKVKGRGGRLVEVSDPLDGARAAAPTEAPNVVVVIGCTVRRDQTSLYRPELNSTPWLAQLGPRGVVFEDMVTAAPWTRPASTAIITGRHAIEVGMVEPGPGLNKRVLPESVSTMAEWFRDAGWHTIGGTANPNLSSQWAMHQGFDRYIEPAGLWSEGMGSKTDGVKLASRVARMLDDAPEGQPVYLQVLLIDAHAPYPDIGRAFGDASVPRTVHRYRAGLQKFDNAVKTLHTALFARGFNAENTIFVVVNDHGEGLNHPEHHGKAHGRYLMPSVVGGVWWMAGPGVPKDTRIWGMASQVDIFPTVAELARVPVDDPEVGISHASILASGRTEREYAFTDTWFHMSSRAAAYGNTHACQDDFAKRGANKGDGLYRPGCFDRQNDPDHTQLMEAPEVHEALQMWRAEAEAVMESFEGASDAEPEAGTLKQLEALGYVDE